MSEIRRASADDIPAMAAVVNAWIDGTPWMPRTHSEDEIKGFIRDAFPVRDMWVTGDPVDGYMSLDVETAKIGALYLMRTGAGIGRAMVDIAKEGRDFVWLSTHKPNVAAQRFYAREGFVPVAEIRAEPPETVSEIRMEWRR